MPISLNAAIIDSARAAAAGAIGLGLLVLHGSRARDDARPGSDWDFAYLADRTFDPDALRTQLADRLHSDQVDLADLSRAGGQLRFRVARDGVAIFEARTGEWERFWIEAVTFWCDAAPILQPAYDALLAELPR